MKTERLFRLVKTSDRLPTYGWHHTNHVYKGDTYKGYDFFDGVEFQSKSAPEEWLEPIEAAVMEPEELKKVIADAYNAGAEYYQDTLTSSYLEKPSTAEEYIESLPK